MMLFTGPAAPRTPRGLSHAVALIGCDEAALAAVLQVETGGAGFDAKKRPKALFEPHLFYALLKQDRAKLARAVAANLAYPRWGTAPYPADSYPRIAAAMAIDEEAPLRATSWGLPQLLGENHHDAGFTDAASMVEAFVSGGEDAQLLAMARFIKARGLARHLVAHDWAAFARGYNGAGYAKNAYDAKLAAAYAHLKQSGGVGARPPIDAGALNAQLARTAKTKAAVHSVATIATAGTAVAVPTAAAINQAGTTSLALSLCLAIAGLVVAANLVRFAFHHLGRAAVFAGASS